MKPLAVLIAIGMATAPVGSRAGGEESAVVRIAYLGNVMDPALLGVRQGLEEANLQGRFLGQRYALEVIDPAAVSQTDFSAYIAVAAAMDADAFPALAESARGRAVFNLGAEDDSLRAACLPGLFHVIPSSGMKRNAEAQWQKIHADADVRAVAWHADFVKFAGRDLNKRFRKAFNAPMDERAWAGWAAVKMLSDSVARGGAADPGALLEFFRSRLSFDGQKGVDMNFRPTGQLRQTLMITEDGRLVGEAPVRGVAAADDLDSLDTIVCSG